MNKTNSVTKSVQEYYGELLKTKEDLKTSACCPIDSMPAHLQPLMANVHAEVQSKFYGCGSPIPHALAGQKILDLGCGTGRDVYTSSQLVGESGYVIGVDMTTQQLAVANKYIDYHMDRFGFVKPNVAFHHGYIEDLKALGIKDDSLDVVISNCVINLSPDKEQVFREIFRVLKPGGELYFSDVFTGRRVPKNLTNDPDLLGECLGGAMYQEDFRRVLRKVGCFDYRIVSKGAIELTDSEIRRKAGMIDFYSMTIRTFKCDFEDCSENYGHVAYYKGTIADCREVFVLDTENTFKKDQGMRVSGNTAKMLSSPRYRNHFQIDGDFSTHYGAFAKSPADSIEPVQTGGCC